MNENIDLRKILKDCPKGTKLYSTIHGEVTFINNNHASQHYPISVRLNNNMVEIFTSEGKLFNEFKGECVLFPSKDQRDWSKWKCPKSKFDPKTLRSFDKVIARCNDFKWVCDMFSHYDKSKCVMPYVCVGGFYEVCIPSNEETKHLVGTTDEAPEYYRYWED